MTYFELEFLLCEVPAVSGRISQGLSIACSTPEAIAWDEEWAGTHERSGRAMRQVHDYGSEFKLATASPTAKGLANSGLTNSFHAAEA